MGFLFPSPPRPAPLPPLPATSPAALPLPTETDPAIAAELEAQRLALLRRRGRKATILTSPLGAADTSPIERPGLLGEIA